MLCSDTGVRIGDGKGASLHLRAVRDALLDLGHDVRLVGVAAAERGQVLSWGPTCRTVPHPGRSEGAERTRRKRVVVERVHVLARTVADRWRPDLVYERLSLFGTAGQRIAADVGVPHVLEVNALLAEEEARWRDLHQGSLARALEAEVLVSAQLRVVVSREVARQVRATISEHRGGPQDRAGRTLVVPNGVDARLFDRMPSRAAARGQLGLREGTFAIGFTGSLRPWHGLEVALEALTQLAPDVELVVAGDGPGRPGLQARAHALGVGDRVHWLGQVAHGQVPEVLAGCDAAIAPYPPLTDFAFSPLKLYEYLAAGLPVVASDLGQLREVLVGEPAGRLVTPGDPAALAEGLAAVRADPTIGAAAVGRASAARIEHSWTARVAQIVDEVSTPSQRKASR